VKEQDAENLPPETIETPRRFKPSDLIWIIGSGVGIGLMARIIGVSDSEAIDAGLLMAACITMGMLVSDEPNRELDD